MRGVTAGARELYRSAFDLVLLLTAGGQLMPGQCRPGDELMPSG